MIIKVHIRKKQEGECDVMKETEIAMIQLGATDHWKPLEAGRGKKQILTWNLQKGPALLTI